MKRNKKFKVMISQGFSQFRILKESKGEIDEIKTDINQLKEILQLYQEEINEQTERLEVNS